MLWPLISFKSYFLSLLFAKVLKYLQPAKLQKFAYKSNRTLYTFVHVGPNPVQKVGSFSFS